MARIVCEYCGTEYDDNMPRCPLCGTVNETVAEDETEEEEVRPVRRRTRSSGGARVAPGEDRIPKWMMILICVVLGIAVVIGAIYALYALGAFSSDKDTKEEDPPTLSLPVTDDEGGQGETEAPVGDVTPSDPTTPSGPVECVSLVVSPDAVIHLSDEGTSQAVTVTVLPSECTEPVIWSSSDESICQVDDNGYITAVDGGKATVTITCGKISREIEVSCDFQNSKENNASLSLTDVTFTAIGDQATLIVNNPPRNAEITWRSEDTSICTVEDGVVKAVGNGTTDIIAIVNDKELTCIARCKIPGHAQANNSNAEGPGSGNRLDHTDVTLGVGGEFEISVVNGISGGWNVTDGSIITVDGNGIVTALSPGTAKVYTILGNERLECIVRVK